MVDGIAGPPRSAGSLSSRQNVGLGLIETEYGVGAGANRGF